MPSMVQAGVYSGVLHYLKAVETIGSKDPDQVAAKMRATPVKEMFARNGVLRDDGPMVHDLLMVRVKTPKASRTL